MTDKQTLADMALVATSLAAVTVCIAQIGDEKWQERGADSLAKLTATICSLNGWDAAELTAILETLMAASMKIVDANAT